MMLLAMAEVPGHSPTSDDAFFGGRFVIVQPRAGGHRGGTDALLLAAGVPAGFAGRVVDLGAGAGTAGLAVAARCPAARVLLVENEPQMAACARATLAHPANRALKSRMGVLEANVALAGTARRQAGLEEGMADFVIMNPPFNAPQDRASPDPLRRAARQMEEATFESWLRTAAAILRPRGRLALIARPASLGAVLAALGRRFGSAEIRFVHPRAERAAIRFVLRAASGARGAPVVMPPLVLHDENGFAPEARAIHNGEAALFRD
jgi:tRNA1(Val) A37 N6-methylase TrmN6